MDISGHRGYTTVMEKELELDGKSYITSKRAAEITGYAQDYIGQLARGSEIDARKLNGSWYVVLDSLLSYGTAAEVKPAVASVPKEKEAPNDTIVSFDGKEFISSKRGAELSGYSQDYVGQLARNGKVLSRQIGSKWYLAKNELLAHKQHNDALLAAVQIESVGLRKEIVKAPVVESHKPLLTYHNEAAFDLMPMIEEKTEPISNLGSEIDQGIPELHGSDSREAFPAPIDGEMQLVTSPIAVSNWEPVPITIAKRQNPAEFWDTGIQTAASDTVERTVVPIRRRKSPRMLRHRKMVAAAALSIVLPALFVASIFGLNAYRGTSSTTKVASNPSAEPFIAAKSTELAAAAAASSSLAGGIAEIAEMLLSKHLHFER